MQIVSMANQNTFNVDSIFEALGQTDTLEEKIKSENVKAKKWFRGGESAHDNGVRQLLGRRHPFSRGSFTLPKF
jgi:hypothetical protein